MTAGEPVTLAAAKKMRVAELRDHLASLGLSTDGTKTDLIARLSEHMEGTPSAPAPVESTPRRRNRRSTNESMDVPAEVQADGGEVEQNKDSLAVEEPRVKSRSRSPSNRVAKDADVEMTESAQRSPSPRKPSPTKKDRSPSPAKAAQTVEPAKSRNKSPSPVRSVSPKHEISNNNNHASADTDAVGNNNNNKKKNKKKKKRAQIERRELLPPSKPVNVEIEYVTDTLDNMGVAPGMPGYEEFAKIFAKFQPEPEEVAEDPMAVDEEKPKDDLNWDDDDDDSMDGSDEDGVKKPSRKELKKIRRMTVAELKQQWFDVTANDPKLLVEMKSYRNTIPVPKHWSQKRKYLQGKKGMEKPLFELPKFIADTGIGSLRAATQEKEDQQSMKSKMRAKMQPKLGRIEIDYQRLHDAFFRFQTKPHMTKFGDMYYEGKEFETKLKEKRPGMLSPELMEALGIVSAIIPPPWLLNMQRYGPPPSYPNLKIPGLNAPIPEGAQWGYHPGGWGKPPVDEFNRPLYGDVFGLYSQYQKQLQSSIEASHLMTPAERTLWGELEPEQYNEEEEEEEQPSESEAESEPEQASAPTDRTGLQTPYDGMATPSGMASVATMHGTATPQTIELRKSEPKALYQVLEQRDAKISGTMGSQHTYDLGRKRRFTANAPADTVDVALAPEDLEGGLTAEMVESKFQQGRAQTIPKHESFTDMVNDHIDKAGKKRKVDAEKKKREFKF